MAYSHYMSRVQRYIVECKTEVGGHFSFFTAKKVMTLHTNACLAIHQLTLNRLCCVLEHKSQTFAKTLIHNYATHHAISLIAIL